MKAFFIDVTKMEVTEVNIENTLKAIYAKIGCRCIEAIPVGSGQLLLIDENGRLKKDKPGCFRFRGSDAIPFFGNALLVSDRGDDWGDINIPIKLVQEVVDFMQLTPGDFPEPQCTVTFLS